ncbi:hypothetical protein [Borreliella burgdorferi]|uniref:hypothetical protein n=1 Tax=Borreliella burgdorferi TaxID=139 RepID=UPI00016C39F8|nr:hypothetical protein [Borreliella burgdorferi]ACN92502.1 hypothetical protein BBU94A_C07 [Borreliella burgdorferi 94a]PRR05631.1 hypothetical protein CV664_05615 [Borreliella burgdorferi]
MVDNNKFKINSDENLLQKNFSNLNRKIAGLETKIFNLEKDIKDIQKNFYKNKAFWLQKFNVYHRKSVFLFTIITPFISIIVNGLIIWLITKFIK